MTVVLSGLAPPSNPQGFSNLVVSDGGIDVTAARPQRCSR
jgi:hypothetical protein